jgi:hypothetical protein
MLGTHERNTDGLVNHARSKSRKTAEKVDTAIRRLIKDNEKINFNSVSEESGVSKAYLYTHPEIRERIDALRQQQNGLPSPKQIKREMTDANKDVIIAAKNKRLRELVGENKILKEEVQKLRGKLYEFLG